VFFMIVATGDHYTLDIAAGVLLAAVAYGIGVRAIGTGALAPVPAAAESARAGNEAPERDPASRKKRAIALGCALFALGIALGIFNRNGFRNAPEAFEYGAGPRFADMFARESEFADNYGAQYYFGSYFLVRGSTARALDYFEKALPLSHDFAARKNAEMRIKQCQGLLGR
jgi:hypothetical protein